MGARRLLTLESCVASNRTLALQPGGRLQQCAFSMRGPQYGSASAPASSSRAYLTSRCLSDERKEPRRGRSPPGRREERSPEVTREKSVSNLGVELLSPTLYEFASHCRFIQRSAIRSLRGHRVERIGEHDYARRQWNLGTLQAFGISSPVPVLVMMHDGRNQFTQARHRRNQVCSVNRMLLDDRPFFRSESRLLSQYRRILVVDLSHVVK